ncbi:hypothetical protein [Microvirga vignae]|nr:hypothetical protein [Microvirga vignae]
MTALPFLHHVSSASIMIQLGAPACPLGTTAWHFVTKDPFEILDRDGTSP